MKITRYPPTENRSLRAWNAGDEYVLKQLENRDFTPETVAISNDRFGYLSCHLHHLRPLIIADRYSQKISIQKNMKSNGIEPDLLQWYSPLDTLPEKLTLGIIGVPKSMDIFRLYLQQLHASLDSNGTAICPFMTRHFSPTMLDIADDYFEKRDQGLAWKKSRLLTLTGKIEADRSSIINTVSYRFNDGTEEELKQYFGVFSSGNIDYATQFLLENLEVKESENSVIDLASGNGVIGRAIQLRKPDAELHLVDDSFLAIESSKLNLEPRNTTFHWNDSLDEFPNTSIDLVVSNPPFHFGHENNIEVTVRLFDEVKRVLRKSGRFICVANHHLNYKTHLETSFSQVNALASNEKYVVYECIK